MTRLVLIGCGSAAAPYVAALNALRSPPVTCIDPDVGRARLVGRRTPIAASLAGLEVPFDAAILTGPGSARQEDLARLVSARVPVLCDVVTAASMRDAWPESPLVRTASPWRYGAWAERLRQVLTLPSFAGHLDISVRYGMAGWSAAREEAVDALADPGAHLLDVLAWCIGPAVAVELVDDARGGPAAEATARVDFRERARVTVELSRLRALGRSVRITAGGGTLDLDIATGAVQSAVAGAMLPAGASGVPAERRNDGGYRALLQAWLATLARGDAALADVGTPRLVADLRARHSLARHAWERTAAVGTPCGPHALRGRNVLVTGAGGFIGSRLVEVLAERGARVTAVVRSRSRAARITRCGVTLVEADLRRPHRDLVAGHDVVFSVAHDFRRAGAVNLAMHRTLADACARHGVGRFVHLSSIAVYDGWPGQDLDETSARDGHGSAYKMAKRAMERDLEARAKAGTLASVILQPTIVYGPFSAFWTDRFLAPLARGGAIALPDEPLGQCNGVYVDDVVAALLAAASVPVAPGAHYIVSGAGTFPWRALIERYAALFAAPIRTLGQTVAPGAPTALRSSIKAALRPALHRVAGALLAHVRDAVGDTRVDRLTELLRRAADRRPPPLLCPALEEPVLLRATGVCSIARAAADLGYAPAATLDDTMPAIAAYAAWRYRGAPFGVAASAEADGLLGVAMPH